MVPLVQCGRVQESSQRRRGSVLEEAAVPNGLIDAEAGDEGGPQRQGLLACLAAGNRVPHHRIGPAIPAERVEDPHPASCARDAAIGSRMSGRVLVVINGPGAVSAADTRKSAVFPDPLGPITAAESSRDNHTSLGCLFRLPHQPTQLIRVCRGDLVLTEGRACHQRRLAHPCHAQSLLDVCCGGEAFQTQPGRSPADPHPDQTKPSRPSQDDKDGPGHDGQCRRCGMSRQCQRMSRDQGTTCDRPVPPSHRAHRQNDRDVPQAEHNDQHRDQLGAGADPPRNDGDLLVVAAFDLSLGHRGTVIAASESVRATSRGERR